MEECLATEQISSQGPFVAQFEEAFARHIGAAACVAVYNGTAALHLALAALRIGPGDEVIVPDLTFAATINAVLFTGATPRLADVDARSWVLDPESCAACMTPKTRAIIPVHLYGKVADWTPLQSVVAQRKIFVVEDCAEAQGAKHSNGRAVGAVGDCGCFSFFANKIMSTGEGGMVSLHDKEWLGRVKMLRDHGMDRTRGYWHTEVGFNYRMTNLQAALGLGQMSALEHLIAARRQVERRYKNATDTLPIVWAETPQGTEAVTWLSTFAVEDALIRDRLLQYLKEGGVDARPGFTPLSKMPPYRQFYHQRLVQSYRLSERLVSIPTYVGISDSDMSRVIDQMQSFFGRQSI